MSKLRKISVAATSIALAGSTVLGVSSSASADTSVLPILSIDLSALVHDTGCTPWKITKVQAVDLSGLVVAALNNGAGQGRRYTEESPAGDSITQTDPPAGWNPLTAPASQLQAFGFPQKPTDPGDLARWTVLATNFKGFGPPGLCTSNRSNALHPSGWVPTAANSSPLTAANASSNAQNPFWAGHLDNGNSYTNVAGGWYQTAFDSGCPYGSAYSTWTGLGGWNTGKLLQSGTDLAGASLNGAYPFWEALNTNYDTGEVHYNGSSGVIQPGDQLEADTTITSSGVTMSVTDWSQNYVWRVGPTQSIGNQSLSSLLDESTAEYITEAPGGGPAPHGRYYLRIPHYRNTEFWLARGNGVKTGSLPGFGIDEYGQNNSLMQDAGAIQNGETFYDNWHSCS